VTQDLGIVELTATPNADSPVRALFSIGAGAYHIRAQGAAGAGFEATNQDLWAALFDAGAGARVSASRHFAVSLEVHGLFASSYPVVRIADVDVGRAARPSMLAALTLVATP
jgi:hypothetical protein